MSILPKGHTAVPNHTLRHAKEALEFVEKFFKGSAATSLETMRHKVEHGLQGLRNLQPPCNHSNIKPTSYGSRQCSRCDEHLGGGWYCPNNVLTHECNYGFENHEECLHCGAPEERK